MGNGGLSECTEIRLVVRRTTGGREVSKFCPFVQCGRIRSVHLRRRGAPSAQIWHLHIHLRLRFSAATSEINYLWAHSLTFKLNTERE